ncbi:MAG: hypothetical protein SOW78_01495 [Clostridia bacterium]|nr:hypothetical protein [Clostridia bacterium]
MVTVPSSATEAMVSSLDEYVTVLALLFVSGFINGASVVFLLTVTLLRLPHHGLLFANPLCDRSAKGGSLLLPPAAFHFFDFEILHGIGICFLFLIESEFQCHSAVFELYKN